MSYNVKGLPRVAGGGDLKDRYREIAKTFDKYDLVTLQEVFWKREHMRDQLPAGDVLAYRSSKRAALSFHLFGNGLAIVGQDGNLDRDGARQRRFAECAGWIRGANDCFARKGVLLAHYALGNGDTLDVFTLHLDAGHGRADRRTRVKQLAEAQALIGSANHARPLVVTGDFNIDRSDRADFAHLQRFQAALGLSDAGALTNERCTERLDYILFRSGNRTMLSLVRAGIDQRVSKSPPLSDHPAIYAIFAY